MNRLKLLILLALVPINLSACSMNTLPRNMSLTAFDPHRPVFTCKYEADVVPPMDPEAELWLHQGLALTNGTLWPEQRDYPKAVQLWKRAADRKHWKAMLNLASVYANGDGVVRDTEHAVQIVEEAMKLGIPGAYDMMGTFHMEGRGVKQDATRAYAFWQLASDMGSASAQAHLGSKMDAIYDDPRAGFWGNRKVALKMLECGFAQGNGNAAFRLGGTITGTRSELDEDNGRALRVWHEGVKFGCEQCAESLSVRFDTGAPLVEMVKDSARGDRYVIFSEALRLDPDLRFPNLDKVLPLPPAPLPKWDGKEESLIDAAKAVVPAPRPPPKPAASVASQRTGRAHVPEGYVLPQHPPVAEPPQVETSRVPVSGYWLAQLQRPSGERHAAWNIAQVPMRYVEGELFDRTRPGLVDSDGRILFHYMGDPVAQPTPEIHVNPRVTRGIAREVAPSDQDLACLGNRRCPATGVWHASVPEDHVMAAVFNQWNRQSYVMEAQLFPDPRELHLDIRAAQITWHWRAEANEIRAGEIVHISMGASASKLPSPPNDDGETLS